MLGSFKTSTNRDFDFNFRTLPFPCPDNIRVCLPVGDFTDPVDLHLRMFVENEEKLIFDQITENICPNAPHSRLLLLPQVPDLQAPGGRGKEGEGIFEQREATDGAGNGQFLETLTT